MTGTTLLRPVLLLLFSLQYSYATCPKKCYCDGPEMVCEQLTQESFSKLHLPSGVTKLEISASQISTLTSGALANLKDLKDLRIVSCGLESIEDKAFLSFNKLEKLVLNRNKLTSLSANLFSGLMKLKFLEINNNEITTIPEGVFNQLINIVHIGIKNNNISALPDRTFTMLPTLRTLHLSYNHIEHIAPAAFQNMTFSKISLGRNRLNYIPPTAFEGMRISKALILLGNPFDCSCNFSMDYYVRLTHLKDKLAANCEAPYSVKGVHIFKAHEDLFCTRCDLHKCANHATCTGDKESYTCHCPEQYKGQYCETNICAKVASFVTTAPKSTKPKSHTNSAFNVNTIAPGSKTISVNDVKYVPLSDVRTVDKSNNVSTEREKILYAMCGLEFVIIVLFVCFFAYKRYLEWREEKRFHDEIGRDLLKRVKHESNLKLAESFQNDPAPKHIKSMILNGSVAV